MPPSSGELWGSYLMPPTLEVDFLLPNGILITLNCAREASLKTLKEVVLKEAKKYPLYHALLTPHPSSADRGEGDSCGLANHTYNSSYQLESLVATSQATSIVVAKQPSSNSLLSMVLSAGQGKKSKATLITVPSENGGSAPTRPTPIHVTSPYRSQPDFLHVTHTWTTCPEPADFVFSCVTQDGVSEEFYDEGRRLCDLRMFIPMLKLVKQATTTAAGTEKRWLKTYDFELGIAMGIPSGKLDEAKDPEIVESRRNILNFCKEVVDYRDSRGPIHSALYLYTPDYSDEPEIPAYLAKYLDNKDDIIICVWVLSPWGQHQKYTVKVHHRMSPKEVIAASVRKKTRSMHMRPFQQTRCIQEYQESYVLKVCGKEEYLFEEIPLFRYQYVKDCLSSALIPQFMLMSKEGLFVTLPTNDFPFPPSLVRCDSDGSNYSSATNPNHSAKARGPTYGIHSSPSGVPIGQHGPRASSHSNDSSRGSSFSSATNANKRTHVTSSTTSNSSTSSVWQMEKQFRFKLASATYINAKDVDKIYVRAGLYHGTELLCPVVESKTVNFLSPAWSEWLTFDLALPHLPRCAKLCLALCSVTLPRKKRGKEERCSLAWGNMELFNFKGALISGKINMYFWQTQRVVEDDFLFPSGTLGGNPNKDAPCLQLEFESFDSAGHNRCLTFPTLEQIEEFAGFIEELNKSLSVAASAAANDSTLSANLSTPAEDAGFEDRISGIGDEWFETRAVKVENEVPSIDPLMKNQEELKRLKVITEYDPLFPLSEQDKEFVWNVRHKAHLIPDSLVVLVKSVRWSNREEVSQLYLLLRKWPKISIEKAFQLLEGTSPDVYIREFAVGQLDSSLSDQQLHRYMMQLVQVIKQEPYADSSLGRFLLRRSLMNKKLGHLFYWLIRSESQYSLNKHYILLLEAYCRGCGSYFKTLIKQVEASEKLSKLSEMLKMKEDMGPKERLKFFQDQLRQPDYLEALQGISSPLNNSFILGDLVIDQCKIMSSAKKPFWLVWTNRDPLVSISTNSNASVPSVNSYPNLSTGQPTSPASNGPSNIGHDTTKITALKKVRSENMATVHFEGGTTSNKRKKSKDESPLTHKDHSLSPSDTSPCLDTSHPTSGPRTFGGIAPNKDLFPPTNELIFKLGDDLRQDMLTLQTIRLMDEIWKGSGLDLKVLPYGCLSTGLNSGLIEAVKEAKTVLAIQKEAAGKVAATLQVTVGSRLHRWIRERNNSVCSYERAIDTFTKSCAGYSVATFILGIGDRHPDNIMINERGQIFHIDFGHFLHHIKKKYGIKRERVPFVLTEDFIRVIAKGAENPVKSKEFERFQELCGEAYLCIRRHANLFLTLFTMMLSAGIPELQSVDDLEYLRTTLAVEEKDEAKAIDYFQTQLCEAYGGAWTTKLDWFFHGMRHF